MMPDSEIVNHAFRLGPWLAGIFISLVGIAARNEWTTAKVDKALFDKNGDLRLMKKEDCTACRAKCQQAFEKALIEHKQMTLSDRKELRQDILRVDKKLDDLPERIMLLINNNHIISGINKPGA